MGTDNSVCGIGGIRCHLWQGWTCSQRCYTYDTVPYQVIATKGTKVTVERSGHRITRNAAFFKVLKGVTPVAFPPAPTVEDKDDDDVEIAAPKTPEHPDRQVPLPP